MLHRSRALALLALPFLAVACSDAQPDDVEDSEAAFSSNQATLLDFAFDGELVTTGPVWDTKKVINDQMLYTIGHLNGQSSVGRLDRLTLTNVTTSTEGGKTKVKYHAVLPVAWGRKTGLPTTYAFTLPRDASYEGQRAFTEKYKHDCVDWGAHDVDPGSMWYYYRPERCEIAAADVVKLTARVAPSPENTQGKYPEYDRVWSDGELRMVAIFGKYEDGATTGDAGINAYNTFLRTMKSKLSRHAVTTTPASLPDNPGVGTPDVTFDARLPDGKKVSVTALLVDNVRTADQRFNDRYAQLSTKADIISYNGHAGLGENVRALAQKGRWEAGKYVIMFINGCDTFAYVDGSLAQTRARINPDDPGGTKYMEFVTNAMPSMFSSMPVASGTLLDGLLRFDNPMTYDQIFSGIDEEQVVLVTGEEDTTFRPGATPPPSGWAGLSASFTLRRYIDRHFATGVLPAGSYTFELSGTGQANLYVKAGRNATSRTYDCKSVNPGAAERCTVTLRDPASIDVLVRATGDASLKIAGRKN